MNAKDLKKALERLEAEGTNLEKVDILILKKDGKELKEVKAFRMEEGYRFPKGYIRFCE